MFGFKRKEKTQYNFAFGLLPSPPDDRDEYIRFLDNKGNVEIYRIINGEEVHVRYETIKAVNA